MAEAPAGAMTASAATARKVAKRRTGPATTRSPAVLLLHPAWLLALFSPHEHARRTDARHLRHGGARGHDRRGRPEDGGCRSWGRGGVRLRPADRDPHRLRRDALGRGADAFLRGARSRLDDAGPDHRSP